MKIDSKIYTALIGAIDEAITLIENQHTDLARDILKQALLNAEDAVVRSPDAFL